MCVHDGIRVKAVRRFRRVLFPLKYAVITEKKKRNGRLVWPALCVFLTASPPSLSHYWPISMEKQMGQVTAGSRVKTRDLKYARKKPPGVTVRRAFALKT